MRVDYADQRFYANSRYGRFNTADPYRAGANGAANPRVPGTWNRYAMSRRSSKPARPERDLRRVYRYLSYGLRHFYSA